MYCSNCGNKINDNERFCPYCGAEQTGSSKSPAHTVSSDDTGSIGWGLLGFFIPIVGIILYFVWKNEKPLNAKIALKGAIISYVSAAVLAVVYVICIFAMVGANGGF
jgi:uncharacterized membrane protein YvbJ